jgi:hypothetical protein
MKEDILYFIIISAVIIISIVRNIKKAQQKTSMPPENHPTPSTPSTWEDLMRELQKQTQPEPEAVKRREPVEYEPISYQSQEEIIDEIESLKAETYQKKEKPEQEPILQEEKNEVPNDYEIKTAEDLKKAIIYSEIMNRKYV